MGAMSFVYVGVGVPAAPIAGDHNKLPMTTTAAARLSERASLISVPSPIRGLCTQTRYPEPDLPVHSGAKLRSSALHDDSGRVVTRPDRLVDREDGREVEQVVNLDKRLDSRLAGPERAGDARVQRLHVVVILRRRIDDGDRQVASAGQGDTRDRAVERVERPDTDAGTGLER